MQNYFNFKLKKINWLIIRLINFILFIHILILFLLKFVIKIVNNIT